MKVLVCGGRYYADRLRVDQVLCDLKPEKVIHGAAQGADTLAAEWALDMGVPVEAYPADWERHGRAAGPIRNRHMLEDSCPDVVVAFPGGKGTADMVKRAKARGVRVIEVT